MDNNLPYQYQAFDFNIAHKLHEFVPPFTLYMSVENAQKPARKHFDKTNTLCHCLLQQLARMKDEVRQREETIKEKQQFLDSEADNNVEMEKKIKLAERTSGRIRDEHRCEIIQFKFILANIYHRRQFTMYIHNGYANLKT